MIKSAYTRQNFDHAFVLMLKSQCIGIHFDHQSFVLKTPNVYANMSIDREQHAIFRHFSIMAVSLVRSGNHL